VWFVADLLGAVLVAFGALYFGWTGVALLACALTGAGLRLKLDRESAIFLGRIAVGAILLVDSILLGIEVAAEVAEGGDDPMLPLDVIILPFVGWLIHLPMGFGMLWLGIKVLEIGATWIAHRRGREPRLPE
jgi:hypothetical protein